MADAEIRFSCRMDFSGMILQLREAADNLEALQHSYDARAAEATGDTLLDMPVATDPAVAPDTVELRSTQTARLIKVDGVLSMAGAEAAREALRQMDADPHGLKAGMVVQPYTEHGERKWVFRCWGTDDGCDGYLSLDHTSQEWAERARDRHVAEDHQPPITPTDQLADTDIVGTESR